MNNKSRTGALRRVYTGLGILAILGLLVCFYYYYISNKEQKLQEQNFRVLRRIEANFKKRIEDNRQLIISKLKACKSCTNLNSFTIESFKKDIKNDNAFIDISDTTGIFNEWEIKNNGNTSQIDYYISKRELITTAGPEESIKVSADIENILTGVLRYDVFPSYILEGKNTIVYNNCQEVCQIPDADSSSKNDNVRELKIGNGAFYIFSHPFSQGIGRGLVLCGLISAADYSHIKYSVPGSFLLSVFLILLIILLAFPFIKSFLVSVEETLDTGDVLLALLSLFLLCYIYTFVHLNTYTGFRDKEIKKDMLLTVNDSIKSSFLSELKSMRQQLNYYDNIFTDSYDSAVESKKNISTKLFIKPSSYSDYYRVFWLNSTGMQVAEIKDSGIDFSSSSNATTNGQDYHDRDYFKAVVNKELWYPDEADSNKIFLQSLYSRNDGSFRAVMSKQSHSSSVAAVLSAEMNSMINTVQPKEINYCLLNKNGDILFTSTGDVHINENLIEECGNSSELKSAIYTRSNTYFDNSFMGSNSGFYISPVNGLPIYLVTFTNNELNGSIQLQVCIFASLFILAILIVFSTIILFLIFLKGDNKNKIVKKPFLDLSLLYPSSNYLYRDFGGICLNIVLIAGLIICGLICKDKPFALILLFLLNAIGTTAAFCYARLDLNPARRKLFRSVLATLFAAATIALFYVDNQRLSGAFISIILYELFLFLVIYELRKTRCYEKDFKNDSILKNKNWNIQAQLVKLQQAFSKRWNVKFYHQFALMLVSWFTLIALLPTVFMYRYFYLNENESRMKLVQIDIARQMFERNVHRKEMNADSGNTFTSLPKKLYVNGFYQTQVIENANGICKSQADIEQEKLNVFLNHFRITINQHTNKPNPVFTGKSDGAILFCKNANKLSVIYQNLVNRPSIDGENKIVIQSVIPGFATPSISNPFSFLFYFIIIPLLFLSLLFGVIWFFLKRFFLFEILPSKKQNDFILFENLLFKYKHNFKTGKRPFKLIIHGVTSSGKMLLAKQAAGFIFNNQYEEGKKSDDAKISRESFISEHLIIFDLSDIDAAIEKLSTWKHNKGDIILLNHFEHSLGEKEANDKKFQIISTILQMGVSRPHLIILSNIAPSTFLNSLKEKSELNSFKTEDYISKQNYYNWTGILSGFESYAKMYYPDSLQTTITGNADSMVAYNAYKSRYTFYLSIWNSLDRLEKFVLYDLAKDNLVNYRNKETLYSLYCKGLIVQKDMPIVMNEELSTFVVSEISEMDVELEKKESGIGSSWNTFRIPFQVILFGVLLFVFITQQETYNKLIAGIVAFAGSLPLLIKLIPTSPEKKSS